MGSLFSTVKCAKCGVPREYYGTNITQSCREHTLNSNGVCIDCFCTKGNCVHIFK